MLFVANATRGHLVDPPTISCSSGNMSSGRTEKIAGGRSPRRRSTVPPRRRPRAEDPVRSRLLDEDAVLGRTFTLLCVRRLVTRTTSRYTVTPVPSQ